MNATTHEPLNLNGEEFAILTELLESEHAKLLVEIRHTHHRAFSRRTPPPADFGGGLGGTVPIGLSGDPA
jgi:hypothetical protein